MVDNGRPGGGFPGIGGGNRPGAGGSGERWPGGGVRPGAGGSGERWPGGGVRPGAGGSGERWPGGGNRPPWAGGGNGDRWPGGGNRPWAGGGGSGDRWPGGGNRPWPGGGNRPVIGGGNIGSGNIGSGNIGHIGDNLGVVNRQNYGGNNFTSNTNNNVFGGNNYYGGNNTNIVSGSGNGGWGAGWGGGNAGWGGGWGAGGGGYGGGGYGGYGGGGYGGWASPYYGNWYRGSWGGNGFLTGLGLGSMTGYGLGAFSGAAGYGYASPYYSSGVYNYFPTWGMADYGSWGLSSMAGSMLSASYVNPYYSTVVSAQPASTTVVYDYSQPINTTATPPDTSAVESTEQVFSAARDSFMAGDYARAVDLADQVLKLTPNAPVVHEFRALALFALTRYDEAAAVDYAVLSAGPGWNWSTLVNLYPDVDTYTNQLRALEAYAQAHRDSASALFLLGYHYMVQGHAEVAANQFERVTKLQPSDTLSASFVKALRKATEVSAQAASIAATPAAPTTATSTTAQPVAVTQAASPPVATPAETTAAENPPPPPPPADMAGTWTAKPAPDVTISLTLQNDGAFSWEVDEKGRKETIAGHAGFKDNTLALLQTDGPPLVGKVTRNGNNTFVFAPPGASAKAPGLTFTR